MNCVSQLTTDTFRSIKKHIKIKRGYILNYISVFEERSLSTLYLSYKNDNKLLTLK